MCKESNAISRPLVAVNAFLIQNDKILLGLRRSSPPAWTIPGGHMKKNESIDLCARREVAEETGFEIDNISILAVINDINQIDHTHYINFFVKAEITGGNPLNGEPEDIIKWEWHNLYNLPTPLFYNLKRLIQKRTLANLLSRSNVYVADIK